VTWQVGPVRGAVRTPGLEPVASRCTSRPCAIQLSACAVVRSVTGASVRGPAGQMRSAWAWQAGALSRQRHHNDACTFWIAARNNGCCWCLSTRRCAP